MKEDKLGHRLIGNITFLLLLLAVLICFACSGKVIQEPSDTTYWRIGLDGEIFTNDLERLQKEIPFTIILPSYLPEEFSEHIPDFIYTASEVGLVDTSIYAYYLTTGSPRGIFIEEYTVIIDDYRVLPNPLGLSEFLKINEYEILEQSRMEPIIDEEQLQAVYLYDWNVNDVYFSLTIQGYSQEVARKIVESIVIQLDKVNFE